MPNENMKTFQVPAHWMYTFFQKALFNMSYYSGVNVKLDGSIVTIRANSRDSLYEFARNVIIRYTGLVIDKKYLHIVKRVDKSPFLVKPQTYYTAKFDLDDIIRLKIEKNRELCTTGNTFRVYHNPSNEQFPYELYDVDNDGKETYHDNFRSQDAAVRYALAHPPKNTASKKSKTNSKKARQA